MSRQLYVFGSNGEGQLGIPVADIVDHPVKVDNPPPLSDLDKIIGGYNHTLFHTKDGEIWGTGDNRKGQLGIMRSQRQGTFRILCTNISFAAATCESSAYIISSSSTTQAPEPQTSIHTQGSCQWGELGRGPESHHFSPSKDDDPGHLLPRPAIDFAAGVWHYIAVLTDGSVYGWGKARLGQLGPNTKSQVFIPTLITDIPFQPVRVVCGKDFTYLVSAPEVGEHVVLGKDKFNICSGKPENVKGWKDIGATWHAVFVLFEDGRLVAWGRNSMWTLIPRDLPRLDRIAVGSEHVLAVTKDGKLISWGWGKHGNCGSLEKVRGGTVQNDMVDGFWNEIELEGEGHVEMIAAGYCTSFVVTK